MKYAIVLLLSVLTTAVASATNELLKKKDNTTDHLLMHSADSVISNNAGNANNTFEHFREESAVTEAIKTTKDEDYDATDGDSDVSDERNPDYFREDTNFIKNINLGDHWGDKNRPEDKKNKVISHISSSFTDGRSFACTKVKPTLITGTSLENLSPEDIGIIASMGDSIATGSGLWPESSIDFRGSSFTTGGDATIDGLVTIPNILKEFGSGNLFGVSHGMGTKDQLPKHQLNVAVSGSNSSFLPNQAKDLVDRIKKVKEIDTYNTWTLVLITVGTEEICNHCQVPNVDALKESMDILNRGIHKALIVLIGPVHVASPYQLKANLLKKRCNCSKHESDDFMIKMSEEWVKGFREVEEHVKQNGRSTFGLLTIPMLTITSRYPFSLFINNKPLLNRRGHMYAAKFLWNRLIAGPVYNLTKAILSQDAYFCPDTACPYFRVPQNYYGCRMITQYDFDNNPELYTPLIKGKPKKTKREIYTRSGLIIFAVFTVASILLVFFYNRSKRGDKGRFDLIPELPGTTSAEKGHGKGMNIGESVDDYLLSNKF